MLVVQSTKGGFYQVQYPDGREAFVKKTDGLKVSDWLNSSMLTGERIVQAAKQLIGVPYLWGGTSTKGLDCSGFTRQVYFMHGVILARDASQQVRYCRLIDDTGDFNDALPGDLVFFGTKATVGNPMERVVHVGIYLGNKRFIHASDYIRINSFDPADPLYDVYNNRLRLLDTLQLPALYSLQWYEGDNPIPGATGFTYCAEIEGLYGLLVTDLATGCTSFYASRVVVNPAFDCTTGTQDLAPLPFAILPNPAHDAVLIRLANALTDNGLLQVWDAGGRLVHRLVLPTGATDIPMDCAAWPNGLFFFEIQSGGYRSVHKLVLIK